MTVGLEIGGKRVLLSYVRDKRGQPRGCLAASVDEVGQIGLGWSLCRRGDNYAKLLGRTIAVGRLRSSLSRPGGEWQPGVLAGMPNSLRVAACIMYYRAQRYFRLGQPDKFAPPPEARP